MITIEGRREDLVCERAMEGLGKLLPERFIVLARTGAQFTDFMKVIKRPMRDGWYARDRDSLRGLPRDPCVVQIGNYFEADNFVEVNHQLETMGRLTNVTVTDWR
jgi:hypothetical protein